MELIGTALARPARMQEHSIPSIPLTFTPQSAVAFASLLAVVVVALIYFAVQRQPVVKPSNDGQPVIAKRVEPSPTATQEVVKQASEGEGENGISPQPPKVTKSLSSMSST